jgi:hypothetical protein
LRLGCTSPEEVDLAIHRWFWTVVLVTHCVMGAVADAVHAGPAPRPPDDAVRFEGHRYKVFEEDLSWHEAKVACEARGGLLACIESAAEQAFIAELCDGRYLYLGATDEGEEGTWVWVNGSPWDFTAWLRGQPNNYFGTEHYLATYDEGKWVDVAAEGKGFWMPTGYICEWED